MIYSLENSKIQITADTHGAELHSITKKNDGTQYLWSRDPEYWKYSAPHLFPIVGKLMDGNCNVDGKTYTMPAHGIARISEFELVDNTQETIKFRLNYSEETLKVYPYKFSFEVSYTIEENSVVTTYRVVNLDDKKIYFCVGAHPAFMCPIDNSESLEDCYLEFNKNENASALTVDKDTYLVHERTEVLNNSNIIPLSKELFKNGLLAFDNLNSDRISIRSKNNDKSLTVEFGEFDYLALWAPEQGAPFVCIEPWFGHADYADFNGEFKEKEGIVSVEKGLDFTASYKIEIN